MRIESLITFICCGIIIIFALITFLKLWGAAQKFDSILKDVNELMGKRSWDFRKSDENYQLEQINTAPLRLPDINKQREEFYEQKAEYSSWSQLCPLFPMLGILGTVIGLIFQVGAEDAAAIYASLDVSLLTTIWGIGAALFLRWFDAFYPGKKVEQLEDKLDAFYMDYQNAASSKESADDK